MRGLGADRGISELKTALKTHERYHLQKKKPRVREVHESAYKNTTFR